ncbi:hypothetical protein IJ732_07600 [bacterium]|nr:hypothetical protein [bacterium]
MKKIFYIIFSLLIIMPVLAQTTLQSGVEIKHVPNSFYGNWRVSSQLVSTNREGMFKEKNIDFWNISRENNVIKLENPFSGASQTVTVKDVKSDFIKFTKVGNYHGKILTDEVTLKLGKDSFGGVNDLKLETISDVDGHVIRTDRASYQVRGEKLSGTSIGD